MMTTCCSSQGRPRPTRRLEPGVPSGSSTTHQDSSAAPSTVRTVPREPWVLPVTISVASAIPYSGRSASERRPLGAKCRVKRSRVSARTGSAALKAQRQVLRSSASRCSADTLRTHRSKAKSGPPLWVPP